jgi:uncharacterized protein (DUF1778 family)
MEGQSACGIALKNFLAVSGKLPYNLSDERKRWSDVKRRWPYCQDRGPHRSRCPQLQGRSISDFVVAAAQEAAKRTIEETHHIRLSMEDQRRFVELLVNPEPLSPGMKRAKAAHARLIRESL